MAQVRASLKHLHGPRRLQVADTDVVLTMLGRDCAFHMEEFFEHHRALGIAHFVYLDNGSRDESIEIAKRLPNTTVLASNLNYKKFQIPFKQVLCTDVAKGGWRLSLDDDERFDYPNSDRIKLPDLARRLDAGGYNGMLAQMLEMVPPGPLRAQSHLTMREVREVFDRCNLGYLRRQRYPEIDGPVEYFCTLNTVEDPEQSFLFDGLRGALFNEPCAVSKHPLFKMAPGVRPMMHPHGSGGLILPPIDAVLYHYKFAGAFLEKELKRIAEDRLTQKDANLRTRAFKENPDLELSLPGMDVRPDFDRLYESGFLFANDKGRSLFEPDSP